MMKNNKEEIEAESFDGLIADEYRDIDDKELILSEERLKNHLHLSAPPISNYRYALYLLSDAKIKSREVLNIACGTGEESVILAKKGAYVYAFDISAKSIEIAQRRAVANKVAEKIHSEVMSVYSLKFKDAAFEFIYGNACLHHFELEKAIKEICCVLKPDGMAVFCEPLGASLFLQKIRRLIPVEKNIVSPNEHQLTYNDIKTIKKFFKAITTKEFGLFIRIDRVIKSKKILYLIQRLDYFLLSLFPFLRKFARSVVIQAIK